MPDTPPDRLSNDPRSPFYSEDALKRDIGVRFKGVEKTNVEEYCVSEGWVRVTVGKAKDRYGNPLTLKLTGTVEPYFKDQKTETDVKTEKDQKTAKDQKAENDQKNKKPEKTKKTEKTKKAKKKK
jgi:Protein of unknown function (DUF3297)